MQKCKEVLDEITKIHNKTKDPKEKKMLADRIAVLSETIRAEKKRHWLLSGCKIALESVLGMCIASLYIVYKMAIRAPIYVAKAKKNK